jgi:hypothetical protein
LEKQISPTAAPAPEAGPIAFDPLGFGFQGGPEPMFLDLEIRGTVVGTYPVELKDAYLISQITGEKMQLMLEAGKEGRILPRDANPIPPELPFWLDAKFEKPMDALQLLSQWGKVLFVMQYDDKKREITFDENYMRNRLASYSGSPLGPHVKRKNVQ